MWANSKITQWKKKVVYSQATKPKHEILKQQGPSRSFPWLHTSPVSSSWDANRPARSPVTGVTGSLLALPDRSVPQPEIPVASVTLPPTPPPISDPGQPLVGLKDGSALDYYRT